MSNYVLHTAALNVEETSLALSYPNEKNLTYVYDGDGTSQATAYGIV